MLSLLSRRLRLAIYKIEQSQLKSLRSVEAHSESSLTTGNWSIMVSLKGLIKD